MVTDAAVPTILGVFAHPDDESLACGGLLARCAAAGARVIAVSLTRGEAGPAPAGAAALGVVRSGEFARAAAILGLDDAVVRGHADGLLSWLDEGVLDGEIAALLARYHPHAVVTFDLDGLYWHPDHIAVHAHVTSAVAAAGANGPALYYVTTPPGQMRAVSARAGGLAVVPRLDAGAFGSHAPAPTLVVDAGPWAAVKLAAIRAHASQFAASAFAHLDDGDAALIAVEHYRRAPVGATGLTLIDRLGQPPDGTTA